MKLAQLRHIPAAVTDGALFRCTEAQDAPLSASAPGWRRHRVRYGVVALSSSQPPPSLTDTSFCACAVSVRL